MIYMFGIDGTLTNPRQKISQEMEEFFYGWMKDKIVFLVTGSDIFKVKEQLSERVIQRCAGIFTCMGNELFIELRPVYRNELKIPDTLIGWLRQQCSFSDYPVKKIVNFEFRTGMLNFSIPGRSCTKEERDDYEKWDAKNKERLRIVNYINRKHPELEACVGGQISVDIQGRGKNKSQAYNWVKERYDDPVYFFGDKCNPGGNDHDIAKEIDKASSNDYYRNVLGPDDVRGFLEEMEKTC